MPKVTIDLDTKVWRSLVALASAERHDLSQQAAILLTRAVHAEVNKRRQKAQAAQQAGPPTADTTTA
jgi:hypothetical protein